ncbi:hypothetical protein [Cupriavidus pinatubonensis]|uniref:hypothetical protein n=1 Tax=Cupriavidus pinatubonensis TaxID=248026 RepID=UPI00361FE49C
MQIQSRTSGAAVLAIVAVSFVAVCFIVTAPGDVLSQSQLFGCVLGADVDRDKVLAAFQPAKEVEVSPDAGCFDHHLAVVMDGIRTDIGANQNALRKLHPQLAGA